MGSTLHLSFLTLSTKKAKKKLEQQWSFRKYDMRRKKVLSELILTVKGCIWFVPDFQPGEPTCAWNEGQPTGSLEGHWATGQWHFNLSCVLHIYTGCKNINVHTFAMSDKGKHTQFVYADSECAEEVCRLNYCVFKCLSSQDICPPTLRVNT